MGRRKYEWRALVPGVGAVRGAGEDGAQQGTAVHAAQSALVFNKLPVRGFNDEDWAFVALGVARVISWRVDGFYF